MRKLYDDVDGYEVIAFDNNDRKILHTFNGKRGMVACVNRRTQRIFVFEEFFEFTPEERMFILYHEAGHLKLGTSDEDACDVYAMKHFPNTGKELLEACNARTRQIRPLVIKDYIDLGILPKDYVPKESYNGRR